MVLTKNPSNFFVNIYESYDMRGNANHIEIDDKGKVIDWFQSCHETITIY